MGRRRDLTEKYNGWANYETWCVNLWLTNEQVNYEEAREICLGEEDEYKGQEALKDYVEEGTSDEIDHLGSNAFAGMISDIFRANLHVVDWAEIWKGLREE